MFVYTFLPLVWLDMLHKTLVTDITEGTKTDVVLHIIKVFPVPMGRPYCSSYDYYFFSFSAKDGTKVSRHINSILCTFIRFTPGMTQVKP